MKELESNQIEIELNRGVGVITNTATKMDIHPTNPPDTSAHEPAAASATTASTQEAVRMAYEARVSLLMADRTRRILDLARELDRIQGLILASSAYFRNDIAQLVFERDRLANELRSEMERVSGVR